MPASMYVFMYLCIDVSMYVCVVCTNLSPHNFEYTSLSCCLSVCMSVFRFSSYVSVYQSVCLCPVRQLYLLLFPLLSVCLYVCLPVHLFIWIRSSRKISYLSLSLSLSLGNFASTSLLVSLCCLFRISSFHVFICI